MASPRDGFRKLMQVFDPLFRPTGGAGDGPGASYVPEVHQKFRAELEAFLELNDNVKLLVAGQPGCGKTTLLRGVVDELRKQGRLAAFVDLEVLTAVQDLGIVEMNLAATAELLESAGRASLAAPSAALQQWARWLSSAVGGAVLPQASAIAAAIRSLLAATRESADVRRQLREQVKNGDPAELFDALLKSFAEHRPVIVLDGLDKLAPDPARVFFLEQKKKPMVDLGGAAIVTIPISMVYEPSFNVLVERYNNADNPVLPALRIWSFDEQTRKRSRRQQGFEVMAKVVRARLSAAESQLILDDAIELASLGSGGNIREMARLLQSSVVKAAVRAGSVVEAADVHQAILDSRESFRRGYQPRFLPLLQSVDKQAQLDNTDEMAKLLLYGLWVMEYRNGRAWYCLPEPVRQLVAQLERDQS